MKKILLIILTSVLSTGAFAQEGIRLVVRDFSEADNNLSLELEVRVDPSEIRTNDSYILTPLLRKDGNVKEFPSIIVNGSRKSKLARRSEVLTGVPFDDAGMVIDNANRGRREGVRSETYSAKVPYERWMDNSALNVKRSRVSCACQTESALFDTGEAIVPAIPPVYEVNPRLSFMAPEQEAVKRRDIQCKAYLDFEVDKSVILPNFRRNAAELREIESTMESVKSDSDVQITGILITGMASPEANMAHNLKLSGERAAALKAYIQNKYDIPAEMLSSKGGGEDWETFRALIEESDIRYRDEILAIIDNSSDLDAKERQLKSLAGGSVFKTLLSDYFPQLRRVDYCVEYTIRAYQEYEIADIYAKNPSMLSAYELYLFAQQNESKREEIIRTMERLFPDNHTVVSNAVARNIQVGNLAAAREWAAKAGRNPEALNNVGVLYMLEGKYETALVFLEQARAAGSTDAVHNLRELDAKIRNINELKKYE